MEKNEIVNCLLNLVQLDIDAVHAYRQAIQKIDIQTVKDQLTLFKADHHRHIKDLSPMIETFGGTSPEFSKDFKGYLIEGFTAIRSITGTEGALKAMKTNEQLTTKTYDKALKNDLPPEVREVVARNSEDEKRHLQYIERALENRVWEHVGKAA